MTLSFAVKTEPVPQIRPRVRLYNRGLSFRHIVYDPARSKQYKQLIAWHAKKATLSAGLKKPVQGPVSLKVTFYMKKLNADIDNLVKAVMDALTGVVWINDRQVYKVQAEKKKGKPEIAIKVSWRRKDEKRS